MQTGKNRCKDIRVPPTTMTTGTDMIEIANIQANTKIRNIKDSLHDYGCDNIAWIKPIQNNNENTYNVVVKFKSVDDAEYAKETVKTKKHLYLRLIWQN